jgi:hypothetical protein
MSEVTYEGGIIYVDGQAIADHSELPRINEELVAENAKLREEVSVARERLGPAGYKILDEVRALRAVADAARKYRSELKGSSPPNLYVGTALRLALFDAVVVLDTTKIKPSELKDKK